MLIHLVFGMAADFGGKPWSWIHHAAVLSAARVNRPRQILFWHEHEPTGEWWDASRPYLTLRKISAPTEVFGRPLLHPAHQADVVRLEALIEHGGVYMDSDVWCLKPFADLEHCGWWMGRQGKDYGLCNATMGGEAGAAFAARWLDAYRSFRSEGRDRYWDEHSVRLPLELAREHPDEITIFGPDYFFSPLWGRLGEIFRAPMRNRRPPRRCLAESYSVHLWESRCWSWLRKLHPGSIKRGSEIAERLQEIGVL